MDPARARSAWGKTDGEARHHLAHHCADVAAVFLSLVRSPIWRRRLETAAGTAVQEDEINGLTILAFLHDIGKVAPAFQVKGWPADEKAIMSCGHLECGWHWALGANEKSLDGVVHSMASWPELMEWLHAIFAHHGRPVPTPGTTLPGSVFRNLPWYDWQVEENTLGQAIRRWFPDLSKATLPAASPRLLHFFTGLLALADWVGSDRRAFPFVDAFDPNYWHIATSAAEARVRDIGLDRGELAGTASWSLISEHPEPRGTQRLMGTLPLDSPVVLLEAETGSGKTEAALWHFARLMETGSVDGLYFAVPTRAAARQLHGRVNQALATMMPATEEAVLAVPGQLLVGEAEGRLLPGFEVLWDDGAAAPARWAAEHATRFLAARVAVGTVDQVLLSALQVKHSEMRGTALSRCLLVVDEVHASDIYMTEILDRVIRDHVALGGHVLLMSATLGAVARSRWMQCDCPSLREASNISYPSVARRGNSLLSLADDSEPDPGKSVHVGLNSGWSGEGAASLALSAARDGARVLVIRNTVDRARETWAAVCAEAPELVMQVLGGSALHHSRFAAEDRALLDRAVEMALGPRQEIRGCTVIGTQTLEQSLDICADLLITDLCPMDVLLQRIGRLHRHDNPRPTGFSEPRAIVLAPGSGLDLLTRRAENGLGAIDARDGLSGVYLDVPGLAATVAQIEAFPVWSIPRMNRGLVEAATHPEALESVAEERGWASYRNRLIGKARAEMQTADLAALDRKTWPPEAYPDDERIKTRLGAEGAVYRLKEGTIGAFGAPIRSLSLPAHWSRGLSGEESVRMPEPDRIEIEAADGPRTFRYGRGGLEIWREG